MNWVMHERVLKKSILERKNLFEVDKSSNFGASLAILCLKARKKLVNFYKLIGFFYFNINVFYFLLIK